jgi:membrane-associated phospholipid phosphatase
MKNKINLLQITNLVVLFICINFANAQNLDIDVLRNINHNRNKSLDPALKGITNSLAPVSIGTPIIMYSVGLIMKDSTVKKKAIFIGEAFLASGFITFALKKTVNRERPFVTYPDIEQVTTATGPSFPSGHASLAFATATSLSMAYPKWYIIAPSFAWASAVSYSRMVLGVHYPSDVLAGAIIGSGSAYLSYKLNKWVNKKQRKKIPQLWE